VAAQGALNQNCPTWRHGSRSINVAFGATLYQHIAALCPGALDHVHADAYDRHVHEISFAANSGLARLYLERTTARVNSPHHQAAHDLGKQMVGEALPVPDGIIEAVRRTPQTIIERLHRELLRAVNQPDIVANLAAAGSRAMVMTPEAFETYLRDEIDKWGRVTRVAGIRAE